MTVDRSYVPPLFDGMARLDSSRRLTPFPNLLWSPDIRSGRTRRYCKLP